MSTTHTDFPSGGGATNIFGGPLIPGFNPTGNYQSSTLYFNGGIGLSIWGTSGGAANMGNYVLLGTGNSVKTDVNVGFGFPLFGSPSGGGDLLRQDDGFSYALAWRSELQKSAGASGGNFGIGITRDGGGLFIHDIVENKVNGGTPTPNVAVLGKALNDDNLYLYVNNGVTDQLTAVATLTTTAQLFDIIIVVNPTAGTVDLTLNGVTTSTSGFVPSANERVRLEAGNDAGVNGVVTVAAPVFNYEF